MKVLSTFLLSLGACITCAQSIGQFQSVEPHPQDQNFHITSTHAFQLIVQADDPLSEGGTKPGYSDFTGFISTDGVSNTGVLGVNSEYVPGGVTFFDIHL